MFQQLEVMEDSWLGQLKQIYNAVRVFVRITENQRMEEGYCLAIPSQREEEMK